MFPLSEIMPIGVLFKVFIKGEDGRWRIASFHVSRREAEFDRKPDRCPRRFSRSLHAVSAPRHSALSSFGRQ